LRDVRRIRQHKKTKFLDAFASVGTITHAANITGIDRSTHYVWLSRDPEYKLAFEEAEQGAIDSLEAEARRRAMAGSDTLLIFLLKPRGLKSTATTRAWPSTSGRLNTNNTQMLTQTLFGQFEAAYLAALAGQPSPFEESPWPADVSLSGDGVAGPEPAPPDP